MSEGIRLGLRLPQRQIATVTTNVPGPRDTLYALGRELQELLPYVPIADRVRVGVAIFSYRDSLTFGLTGDFAAAPDLDAPGRGDRRVHGRNWCATRKPAPERRACPSVGS